MRGWAGCWLSSTMLRSCGSGGAPISTISATSSTGTVPIAVADQRQLRSDRFASLAFKRMLPDCVAHLRRPTAVGSQVCCQPLFEKFCIKLVQYLAVQCFRRLVFVARLVQ